MNVTFGTKLGDTVTVDTKDIFAIRLPEPLSEYGRVEIRTSAAEAELLMHKVLWGHQHEKDYDTQISAVGEA
jgi:hypothetical protein